MKSLKPILLIFVLSVFLALSCKKNKDSNIITTNQIDAKIFRLVGSLDENNQPKDYYWVISTNKDYIDSLDIPIDDNILAPTNLLDDFKIPNLKVIVSGKKNMNENHVLTLPEMRVGFGYSFEITEIKINK